MKSRKEQGPGTLKVIEPQAESAAFVAAAYHPPAWATGFISRDDMRFLYEALLEIRPARIMEVGVASGVSTVLLLEAIEAQQLDATLYSFDITDRYYADTNLRLGQYIFERYGTPPARLSLNPLVASVRIPDRLAELGVRPVDFTFIDANHYHPWPCLDLLSILTVVEPGSWVALHDIDLPNMAPEFPCYGPLRLFTNWPGERLVCGTPGKSPNIGAIKLFDHVNDNVDAILAIAERDWDVEIDPSEIRQVYEMLRGTGQGRARRLRSIHFRHMRPRQRRQFFLDRIKDAARLLLGRPARA